MKHRSTMRRAGGVLLLALWAQIGTANAVPCALACARNRDAPAHHEHASGTPAATVAHMAASTVSTPEYCGSAELLVVAAIAPCFPGAPPVDLAMVSTPTPLPSVLASTPLDFESPPPKA